MTRSLLRAAARQVRSRIGTALVLGSLTAACGLLASLVPPVLHLEEDMGLDLLFQLRGPRPPPAEVLVVGLDRESSDRLGLPFDPGRWPRAVHAGLLDALARGGAAMVALDLVFEDARAPDDDRKLADAIRRAGNVVLAAHLLRDVVALPGVPGAPPVHAIVDRLVTPLPDLAEAALAVAPFPVPKVPVKVSRYWVFKSDTGGTPTLPAVALQVFALDAYGAFVRLLGAVAPGHASGLPPEHGALLAERSLERVVRGIRETLQRQPAVARAMATALDRVPEEPGDPRRQRELRAMLDLYREPDVRHLNFYGPPGTLATVPYHVLLGDETSPASPPIDLEGKAVFVGLSDPRQPHQRDGFYTVFSQPSGSDLSGVEIAATAFANLLDGSAVKPVPGLAYLGLVLAWGFVVGGLTRLLPSTGAGALAVVAASLLYFLAVAYQFRATAHWLPWVIPLLFQSLPALAGIVLWSYSDQSRERQAARRALALYLPPSVAEEVVHDLGDLRRSQQVVYGTCLSTDAHQYTSLAEQMDPTDLTRLMNEYYATVFEPVRRHGGTVQDVVGDSMLAVWATAHPDAALRRSAGRAALEIAEATERFGRESGVPRLPTRIGLHSGRLVLANIGAIDHYEYRAVGDIVNAATRLEGLNKHLGTQILMTGDVLADLDDFLTRDLGRFLVVGKSKPLVVQELIGLAGAVGGTERARCARFAEALALYRQRDWRAAHEAFLEILHAHGEDGPSRFYGRLCQRHAGAPPGEDWDAVVRMDEK